MGLFDNCILASDIDGTLISNGYLNPRNLEKIEFFMKEGGSFSLSTGRGAAAIGEALGKLKRVSPCIVANGTMIYDYEKDCSVYDTYISESDYRFAELICNCGLNIGCEIHIGKDVFTLRRTSQVDDHQRYENFSSEDITFEEVCRYKWNKAIFMFDSVEDREKLAKMLESEKSECAFIETAAEFDGGLRAYYEMVPRGVSKASALLKLAEMLKIKEGRIFAIGDYYNDTEMLKAADISAAPGDSPEDIRQIADYITVPCKDGAVADFIDYLTNIML